MMEGYFRCVTKVQLQDLKTGLCIKIFHREMVISFKHYIKIIIFLFCFFIIIFMLVIDNKK